MLRFASMSRRCTTATAAAAGATVATAAGRGFHGMPDAAKEARLKGSMISINRPRGRDMASDIFEKRIHLVRTSSHGQIFDNAGPNTAVVDLVAADDIEVGLVPHPSPVPHITELGITAYSKSAVKNLLRNADSWSAMYLPDRCGIIHLVDPILNHRMYRRTEAQVELIAGYRNALYEFYELHQAQPSINRLRIPALSLYTADAFVGEIAKINQQALIKGFHRVATQAKDWICSSDVHVELYVPESFMLQFETAFAEEPWLPMASTAHPGRRSLYSNMPVPRQMLDYPGWHGDRPELLAAPETEGQSIEDARQLDPNMLRSARDNARLPRQPNNVQIPATPSSSAAVAKEAAEEEVPLGAVSHEYTPDPEIAKRMKELNEERIAREHRDMREIRSHIPKPAPQGKTENAP